ncbi:MAG: pyridoxamine 5'-phosphate oxidase family protein [Candidatus Methanoplasma sp.]|jgi:predicted pyridoxine 5'-phosphate oxidase superfamily flavin-nucleotide-binding protein|nr:pyridoxamine 5'-phosphate oxidase family protein [Candidatus Methanoplasma sp.]
MVKLNDDVKSIFAGVKIFSLATASKAGVPNVVPVGMLFLQPDDETVWIVDNFMDKTLTNLKENPKASFYIWSPEGADAYQIKGTVTIENSGADYQKAVDIAHKKRETLPAKNLIKLKITDVFYVTSGPKAGKRV